MRGRHHPLTRAGGRKTPDAPQTDYTDWALPRLNEALMHWLRECDTLFDSEMDHTLPCLKLAAIRAELLRRKEGR